MPKQTTPHNRQNLPESQASELLNPPAQTYHTHSGQKSRISMIATPIGNLADITERARLALEEVDELWCEDTRHTQSLLNALGIARGNQKQLKRVDQHTTPDELNQLLERVEISGQWIGVVTDAGTPGVSDPGAKIAELLANFPQIRLEAIPGASAVSAFVSIAGIHGAFSFHGFFPRSDSEQIELLNRLKDQEVENTWIFFESPNRLHPTVATLKAWCDTLDFKPKFVLSKEISKVHENLFSGVGGEFLEWFQAKQFDERGEWVFSIKLPKNCVINKKSETDWQLTLECLVISGISTKDAASLISERFLIAKKLAYQSALQIQNNLGKKIRK